MADLTDLFGGHFMSPVRDPYPAFAALRRTEPVKLVDLPMGPGSGYLVTRYRDVHTVLTDAALFSSRANADGTGLVMGRTIIEMDAREHTRHRGIIAPAFVPKAIRDDMPAVVERMVNELIDRFASAGEVDLVSEFAFQLPIRVIAHVIGIPVEEYARFHHWGLDIIGFVDDPPRGFEAARELVEFLRPMLEARRAEPRGDLMSRLAHADVEGERLTDEEIFSFLRLLLPAGAETTYRLSGNTLFALLHDEECLGAARAEPEAIDRAIEESLRWEAPVQFAVRETTAATRLADIELAPRVQVLVALGSANRDEEKFPDPARFDPNRSTDDHMGFGFGRHFCVGAHLARLEARTAIRAAIARLKNLRLARDPDSAVVGLAFRSPNRLRVQFDRA